MGFFSFLGQVFGIGGGRNAVVDVAEVFRENAENGAQRRADYDRAALGQFTAEFAHARRGWFDRLVDGLNRLPRPLIVLFTFALFASAMFDPTWFAERMQGLALVPDPLWWLAGTVVAFYFGGRMQIKAHEARAGAVQAIDALPQVMENIRTIRELRHDSPGVADAGGDGMLALEATSAGTSGNPAIDDWKRENGIAC